MIFTPLTKKALEISFRAHRDQTDKGGLPYVYHPYRVAEQQTDEMTTCVALLHDVVEDTAWTPDGLREAGFPEPVVEAVTLMTHDKRVPYLEYVGRIGQNPIARQVKLADLKDNSNPDRLDAIDDKVLERLEKYRQAIRLLTQIIESENA